ncbi:MAG: General substrate transporter [Candidatus Parvarchaeum acidophilus ARMAN-5]|uniref:General substrate transporter n=1 Tax=Candidatus Parvarchaeum acidophilus ARMAN-5 TaxID=662762 RepID=D6GUT2_PARA5|nr:MAG: General substrate transporter [Candidatus Parvarchaeum acidophilus ARMAN-5]
MVEKSENVHVPRRSVITTLSAMGYFLDGYDLSVISVFTLVLVTYKIFQYSAFTESFVTGSALLGAFVGAVIFGHYADRIGRRYLYILDLIFFAVFALLSAFSTNITEMIIFRFFVGWGVGADYALSPVYTTEMYPNKKRGAGYGWVWTFWSIGAVAAFILGYVFFLFNPLTSWRWVLALGAIPAIITVILRTRMPESARWKIMDKGSMDKNVKTVAQKIGLTPQDIKAILSERQKEANIAAGSFTALFKGEYGKRTAIVWTQWIVYDLAGYGIGLYAPLILKSLGVAGSTSLLYSFMFYMPIGFLGAFGAVMLNDRIGRRPLQALGFGGMAIAMLLFFFASTIGGTIAISIGILAFILDYGLGNLGPGNTMGLYAIELLPTKLRSSSMGGATGITRIASFASAFLFPYLTLTIGKASFFAVLLALMIFVFFFTIFFTPETKGLTLEEISIASYKHVHGMPKLVMPSS